MEGGGREGGREGLVLQLACHQSQGLEWSLSE